MKDLVNRAVAALRKTYRENPVRVVAFVASALVAVAAATNVTLDSASTSQVVSVVLLILLGGETARQQVTPVEKAERKIAAAKRQKP